jgi:hypothetical protein
MPRTKQHPMSTRHSVLSSVDAATQLCRLAGDAASAKPLPQQQAPLPDPDDAFFNNYSHLEQVFLRRLTDSIVWDDFVTYALSKYRSELGRGDMHAYAAALASTNEFVARIEDTWACVFKTPLLEGQACIDAIEKLPSLPPLTTPSP